MDKKYWSDCPKEERLVVRRLIKAHKNLNYELHHKKITRKEYKRYVEMEFKIADYIEWYFSDNEIAKREYQDWKRNYEVYEKLRQEREYLRGFING